MKRHMEDISKFKIINTNPKSMKKYPEVWRIKCNICEQDFSPQHMELDHINGNNTLKSLDDIQPFIEGILLVPKKDLQWLCVDRFKVVKKQKVLVQHGCHEIKTYSERYNVSFKEASIIKYVLEIIKNKKDKDFFIERGLDIPSNVDKRREAIVTLLTEELNNDYTVEH